MYRILLAIGLASCFSAAQPEPSQSGSNMTPATVTARGSHVFDGDRSKVYTATIGALRTLGYDIAFTDETSGVIKTTPRDVRTQAYANAYQAVSVTYTRSYVIKLDPKDASSTRVEATPRLFENGADISQRPVWALDSPQGEYALWDQLFREIGSNLGGEARSDASRIGGDR
jgi:hypothetical protein